MQAISLTRESEATDERVREAFRDIKGALRVSVVSDIFQAWAAFPKFLEVVWRRMRPSVLTSQFAALASSIDAKVRAGAEDWAVGDHAASLRARAAGESDIARMREIVELFAQLDPKLMILASAVSVALTGASVGGGGTKGPHRDDERERPREFRGARFGLVEERDAPPRVRSIYDDIKATLGLPFVATEYRAMATYPDWLEIWWKDCKPRLQEPRYRSLCDTIARAGTYAAGALPHQLFFSAQLLESSDIVDAKRDELRRVSTAFEQLLPGLIVNAEIARRGLG